MKSVYIIVAKYTFESKLSGEQKILGVYASRKTAEDDVAEFKRQHLKADFTIKQYTLIE